MTIVYRLHHRGFALTVCARPHGRAYRYAFGLSQGGHALHTSDACYRSVPAADRAGRCFVDDALGAYAHATQSAGVRSAVR